MNFDIFIISWSGQHENARSISEELDVFRSNLCVVYSDPNPECVPDVSCNTIRRPDELYWGDKFSACLDAFRSDILLVIQADCRCSDWVALVNKSVESFHHIPSIGVWAPRVRGTPYDIEFTRIRQIDGTSMSSVAQTDCLCFSLSAPVVSRMKAANYVQNIYGWGISWMMISTAYCQNSLVLVDEGVVVDHPIHSGYSHRDAFAQMKEFMKQLSPQEQAQYQVLDNLITLRRIRRSPLLAFKGAVAQGCRNLMTRLAGIVDLSG